MGDQVVGLLGRCHQADRAAGRHDPDARLQSPERQRLRKHVVVAAQVLGEALGLGVELFHHFRERLLSHFWCRSGARALIGERQDGQFFRAIWIDVAGSCYAARLRGGRGRND